MKSQNISKRIVKNSFWSFSSAIINRLGALVFTIILARFLMPEGYGIYSIVLSTAMIFYTFADLGINQTLVRYISSALARDRKKVPSYHRYLLKIKFFLSLLVSLLLLVMAYPISIYIFKNNLLTAPFFVAAFYIFILSFEGFYSQVFYSIEKVHYLGIKETLSQILRIVFALLVFYFIASSYQVMGIFASLIIISLILLSFSLYYTKKLIPDLYKKPRAVIDKKRVRKFVGFLTIASISSVFFSYVDSIMLGLFVTPEFVGYYKAAFSLVIGAMGLTFFPPVVLLPIFTKLRKSPKLEYLMNNIFRYITITSIPAMFGIVLLGKYFIRIFYGYSYLPSSLSLYFLAFLILPSVAVSVLLYLYSAEEKPQIFARLIIITSLINIILNLILIKAFLLISPLWATAGASIATIISWYVYFILSIYISKKEFNIKMNLNLIVKPLISSLIMAGILFYLISLIEDMTLFLGANIVILGILIYFICLFLMKGLKKEDINLIKLLFKK